MIRITTVSTVIALVGLLHALPVAAQTQQPGPLIINADGGGVHQSEADLKDGGGGFATDRWFVSGGLDYAWSPRNSIGFSVGGGKTSYEFDSLTGFGGGDPWNKIEEARVSVTARFGFGETGSFIIIPSARWNGEKGAGSGDSATYGLFAAAAWRISESLTIGPGIGVFSRLESGSQIFPVLAIDWDISDRWNLSTGRGLAASQGPGLTLSYELNQNWSFGLSGRYEDLEFRLDDEGPAAGGVGRDQSFPLVVSAILAPNSTFKVAVFAGLEFGGKLKLKDSAGVVIDESSYDPAPLVGATFEVRF